MTSPERQGDDAPPFAGAVPPDDAGWGASEAAEYGGSVWPDARQELLLRAGLSEGDAAVRAWEAWRAEMDLDRIGHSSGQLLPLVYRNLYDRGVRDPWLEALKPHYRAAWIRNQTVFHLLERTLVQLHEAGVDTLVLKGAALSILHYGDDGVRGMSDFDVVVPEARFAHACRVVLDHGWVPFYHDPKYFDVRFDHAIAFVDGQRNSVDLHCHVLAASCESGADDAFWEAAVPMQVGGVATRSLCAAHHLVHACVHGVNWVKFPPVRWVADAVTIIRSAGEAIDWNRVVETARARGVTLQVAAPLEYLRATFGAAVPEETIDRLRALPVPRGERRRYELWSQNRRGRPISLLAHHWAMYTRGIGAAGPLKRAIMMPQYLRFWAQTDRLWKIPLRLAGKGARVLGRRLGLYRYWDGT